ncbi:MAG: outer membrane beta-barrel domain-containing protein, partial [Bdellovibrionota bacterium]
AKKGRHEFTFGMGAILDNPFLRYELAQFRYNYHFRETFAVELSYQYAFNQQKSLIGQLEGIQCAPGEFFDEDGNDLSNVPGACGVSFSSPPDPFVHTYIANLVWSPIYGKFSIFSRKIYHFDLFFTAGAGYYDTERSGYIGFNAGLGGKIFLNDWLAFRGEIRNLTVKEGAPFNNIVNNRVISVGFSVFAPFKNKREK